MRAELLLAVLASAALTYAMRAGPLLLSRRAAATARRDGLDRWLQGVAPAVLAALLVTAVLPAGRSTASAGEAAASLGGVLAAAGVAARWGHPGLAVLAGMAAYGLLRVLP